MSRCQHLIDISPYAPLCDHPCRLYGGGAVEAECETCQYRIEETLEAENAKLLKEPEAEHALAETLGHCYEMMQAENAKLRELVRHLYEYRQLYFKTGIYPTDHGVTEQRMRDLGVEVDE